MKRVYDAGAYSANNVLDVLKNIGKGQKLAADVFLAGHAPFTPWHDRSFIIDNPDYDFNVPMFYDMGIKWLDVSDCVLLIRIGILGSYRKSAK